MLKQYRVLKILPGFHWGKIQGKNRSLIHCNPCRSAQVWAQASAETRKWLNGPGVGETPEGHNSSHNAGEQSPAVSRQGKQEEGSWTWRNKERIQRARGWVVLSYREFSKFGVQLLVGYNKNQSVDREVATLVLSQSQVSFTLLQKKKKRNLAYFKEYWWLISRKRMKALKKRYSLGPRRWLHGESTCYPSVRIPELGSSEPM